MALSGRALYRSRGGGQMQTCKWARRLARSPPGEHHHVVQRARRYSSRPDPPIRRVSLGGRELLAHGLDALLDRVEVPGLTDLPALARVVLLHAAAGALDLEAEVHLLLAAAPRLGARALAVAGLREEQAQLAPVGLVAERLESAAPLRRRLEHADRVLADRGEHVDRVALVARDVIDPDPVGDQPVGIDRLGGSLPAPDRRGDHGTQDDEQDQLLHGSSGLEDGPKRALPQRARAPFGRTT